MDSLKEKFNKKFGSGVLLNETAAEYFHIVNTLGTVGLIKEDYLDDIEYNPILMGVIPKNKHFASFEEYGYSISYIKKTVNLINPNEYGFHKDAGDDKILVFRNGINRIAIAPDINDWKELSYIPLTDLFRARASSVMVI